MNYYKGLSNSEVEESRQKHGSNNLTPAKRESGWKLFFSKFKDPLIKVLLVATLLSLITGYFEGSMVESLGIVFAILLATTISFFNEYKAGKEFDILNKINDSDLIKVIRNNGVVTQIKKTEIVVGDVVVLATGDEIPADGKLLESMELRVNESSLNGESKASNKTAKEVKDFDGAYSPNYVYRGTTVSEGDGVFEVTAVGDSTEIGKTARQASEITGAETPLSKQLTKLGAYIGKVGMWIAAATFVILIARDLIVGKLTLAPTVDNLAQLLEFFMVAVTLIVMAVPEGLPMSVTLSLAYSMRKMTAQHTLVRKMHACETMGAATVICTDKTGTLTQNKMKVHYCSVRMSADFAAAISVNSTAFLDNSGVIGNPTEGALLMHITESGYDYMSLRENSVEIQRIPFSTLTKYMATLCSYNSTDVIGSAEGLSVGNKICLYIKGAPETLVSKCKMTADNKVILHKDEHHFENEVTENELLKEIGKYQNKGMRSLAFAHCYLDASQANVDIKELVESREFIYDGFAAIADPVREDVPAAMQECVDAGIAVKIVTGDTSLTAIEIAKQSGLWNDKDTPDRNCITGGDFEKLSDEEALRRIKDIKVMSRARPADKMRLVKLLQQQGEVVAVTGDGTNDAPALNYADVGLAMGSGTAVAKESSDIILLDDSFSSVVSAVQWGRSIYINIQKFIYFQLTVNVAALLTALFGPMLGIEFPLKVTQILWVNLIMDTFAAIALATEPSRKEVMKSKPRKMTDFIITKKMLKGILGYGIGFFVVSLLFLLLKKYEAGYFVDLTTIQLTEFFTFFVLMQYWNLFNARALGSTQSAFSKLSENKPFLAITSIILLLQVIIVEFGGKVFRTEHLSFNLLLDLFLITSAVLWIGEIKRLILRRNLRKKR
ncbi:MAG: calcium-translocating P-type ATPase, PMCA-type [Bacteroidales bacterium]|jgi:Ca2+-transporting ATPase|nr:calcium-translocating P-type ATPase, PMCA-type [Bacteroidales bacterium]